MTEDTLKLVISVFGAEDTAKQTDRVANEIRDVGQAATQAAAGVGGFTRDLAAVSAAARGVGTIRVVADTASLQRSAAEIRGTVAGLSQQPVIIRAQTSGVGEIRNELQSIVPTASDAGRAAGAAIGQGLNTQGNIDSLHKLGDEIKQTHARATELLRDMRTPRDAGAGNAAAGAGAAVSSLKDVTRASGEMTSQLIAGIPILGRFTLGLGAIGAAAAAAQFALRPLVNAILAPVRAASEAQDATVGLQAALSSLGGFSTRVQAELSHYASALQDVTGESDEAIMASQTLLIQIAGLSGETLNRATRASLELASVFGSLQASTLQVAKAAEGQDQGLRRLGFTIDESLPPAERFAAILSKIEDNLGGTAAARAQTLSGSFRALRNSFSDLLEELGKPFLGPVTSALNAMTGAVRAARDAISEPAVMATDALKKLADEADRFGGPQAILGVTSFAQAIENLSTLKPVRLAIEKGNTEEIRSILDEIERQQARIASAGVDPIARERLNDIFAAVRAQAQQALLIRVAADDESIQATLSDIATKLLPKTLPVEIAADTRAIESSLQQLEANAVKLGIDVDVAELRRQLDETTRGQQAVRVPVQLDVTGSDLANRLGAFTPQDDIVVRMRAQLEAEVPTATEARIRELGAELNKDFDEAVKGGTEQSTRLAASLVPVIARFRELRDARVKVTIEQPSLDPLNAALRRVVELRAEVTKQLPPIGNVDAANVVGALESIKTNYIAAASTANASSESLRNGFSVIESAVKQAAQATPALKGELETFLSSLQRVAQVKIGLAFNTEQAQRDAKFLGELAASIRENFKSQPVALIDSEATARAATDAVAAANHLKDAVREAAASGDVETLAATYKLVTKAATEAGAAASNLGTRARAGVAEAASAVAAARDILNSAEQFNTSSTRFAFAVDLGDVPLATAELAKLKGARDALKTGGVETIAFDVKVKSDETALTELKTRLAQKALIPVHLAIEDGDIRAAEATLDAVTAKLKAEGKLTIEVEGDLKKLRRDMAQASILSRDGGKEAARQFRENMADLGVDTLANAFEQLFGALIGRVENLGDALKNVFKGFVDAIIKELARIAAVETIRFVAKLAGFPIPTAVTPEPIADRSTTSTSQKALPAPAPSSSAVPSAQQRVVVAPEIIARPRVSIDLEDPDPVRARITVGTPAAIEMAPPQVRTRPLAPLTVQPILRTSIVAALEARPRFVALAADPVRAVARVLAPAAQTVQSRIVATTPDDVTVKPAIRVVQPPPLPVEVARAARPIFVEPEVRVAPQVTVAEPEDVEIAAPELRTRPLAPVTVQPVVRAGVPSPVEARPRFTVGAVDPIRIAARFVPPATQAVTTRVVATVANEPVVRPQVRVIQPPPLVTRAAVSQAAAPVLFEPRVIARPRITVDLQDPDPIQARLSVGTPDALTIDAPPVRMRPAAALAATPLFRTTPPAPIEARAKFVGLPADPVRAQVRVVAPAPQTIAARLVAAAAPPVTVRPNLQVIAPDRTQVQATITALQPAAQTVRSQVRVQAPPEQLVAPRLRLGVVAEQEVRPRLRIAAGIAAAVLVAAPAFKPAQAAPIGVTPTFRPAAAAAIAVSGPRFIVAAARERVAVAGPAFAVTNQARQNFLLDAPTVGIKAPRALAPIRIELPVIVPEQRTQTRAAATPPPPPAVRSVAAAAVPVLRPVAAPETRPAPAIQQAPRPITVPEQPRPTVRTVAPAAVPQAVRVAAPVIPIRSAVEPAKVGPVVAAPIPSVRVPSAPPFFAPSRAEPRAASPVRGVPDESPRLLEAVRSINRSGVQAIAPRAVIAPARTGEILTRSLERQAQARPAAPRREVDAFDVISKLLPASRPGDFKQEINVSTIDAYSFETQLRRGPLARAGQNASRFRRP